MVFVQGPEWKVGYFDAVPSIPKCMGMCFLTVSNAVLCSNLDTLCVVLRSGGATWDTMLDPEQYRRAMSGARVLSKNGGPSFSFPAFWHPTSLDKEFHSFGDRTPWSTRFMGQLCGVVDRRRSCEMIFPARWVYRRPASRARSCRYFQSSVDTTRSAHGVCIFYALAECFDQQAGNGRSKRCASHDLRSHRGLAVETFSSHS
jgi:hypothetical protein